MSSEQPNLLKNEIHTTFDSSIIGGGTFQTRISALEDAYPTTNSQNKHMYKHIIRELNRKLDKFGFADQIVQPIDAGFSPLDTSYASFFTSGQTFWNWTDVGRNGSIGLKLDLQVTQATDVYWNGAENDKDTYAVGRNTKQGTWTSTEVFSTPLNRRISISDPGNVETFQVLGVSGARFSGDLNLSGFTGLKNFFCDRQDIKSLNLDTTNNTLYRTIRADFNNITGSLPVITGLSNLRTFAVTFSDYTGTAVQPPTGIRFYDVADNHLTGTVPDFTDCGELRGLFLHNNDFTGNMPDITANTKLVDCQMERNDFVGEMPAISGCPNLLFFDTASNDLTGTISVISGNTPLIQMWCNRNNFTGSIPHLEFNTNLIEFQCAANNLTGWDGTGVAPSLKQFWGNDNDLSQGTIDNLIKAFDELGNSGGILYIGGSNAVPSSSSNSRIASLTGRNWSVFVSS